MGDVLRLLSGGICNSKTAFYSPIHSSPITASHVLQKMCHFYEAWWCELVPVKNPRGILDIKVSYGVQTRKEVKCRHRPIAAAITSPFLHRSAVFPGWDTWRASPGLPLSPGWMGVGTGGHSRNESNPSLSAGGEERRSTALMHQRWGFRWLQRVQTTPLHENHSHFIITYPTLLEEGSAFSRCSLRNTTFYLSITFYL